MLQYLELLNHFCLCFVYFSVPKRQSLSLPFTLKKSLPSFSGRPFQRSASSSDCIAKGAAFPTSSFFSIPFSIVYLLFIKTIFCRLKVLFVCRQVIFSLECFSRQGPKWSALTSKSCVIMPHWKGRAELNSGQGVITGPLLNCFHEIGFAP